MRLPTVGVPEGVAQRMINSPLTQFTSDCSTYLEQLAIPMIRCTTSEHDEPLQNFPWINVELTT